MVGKLVVSARQFYSIHMAGGAILGVAGLACSRFRLASGVTGLALRIVIRVVVAYFTVRVVTSQTTDAPVVGVITLAVGQAVRLKANIRGAVGAIHGNLLPRPVALPAEVGRLLGGHRG